MKQCQACGNVQDTGNFCAKCGGQLVDFTQSNNVEPGQQSGQYQQQGNPNHQENQYQQGNSYQQQGSQQPNVHVEKVKTQSKMYFSYFTEHLKSPSAIFGRGENEFINGIITVIAYALIFGLTLFTFASKFGGYFFDASSQFFPVFGGGALTIIVLTAIVIISLFVINKFFGPDQSFKEILSNYGALIIPSLLLMVVVFLLFLMNTFQLGFYLLFISILLAIIGVPLYIITRLLGLRSKSVDAFYAYLLYIVLFLVLYWIASKIFIDNTVGGYIPYGW